MRAIKTLVQLELLLVAAAFSRVLGVDECNTFSGPAGINRCVKIGAPYYNDYQWATCLTNSYIKERTGGKYTCVRTSSKYCWYQCMLEDYEALGPDVYGICVCNGNSSTISTTTPSGSTLPPMCYSPDGTDCSWYGDCLEKKYPCKGTSAGYAVEYATKFCQQYTDNYDDFSSLGRRWIDSVRRCLQVELVPLLRQYWRPTCAQIRQAAFDSHTPCYLKPPSVCNLPLPDYFQIMSTIYEAFLDPTTATESLCSGLDVFRSCNNQWKSTRPCLRAFVVEIGVLNDLSWLMNTHRISAANIAHEIGKLMKWDSLKLKFLGCLTEWLSPSRGFLNIIIFGPAYVNCLKSVEWTIFKRAANTVNMDNVARDFENAVKNGNLLLTVGNATVYVTAIGACDPMSCANVTATNITAPPTPVTTTVSTSAASALQTTWLAAIFSGTLLFFLKPQISR